MEGLGIGQLNVYKRSEVNGELTNVWSRTQERGDNWFYASVGLGVETRAFQVIKFNHWTASMIGVDNDSYLTL